MLYRPTSLNSQVYQMKRGPPNKLRWSCGWVLSSLKANPFCRSYFGF